MRYRTTLAATATFMNVTASNRASTALTTTTADPYAPFAANMDRGDFREHADNSQYSEKYSALGFRIGVNYVIYSMSH